MKQYIGKENVCFCLLTPSTGDNQNNIINERYLKDYNEVLSKFIAKGKEWLGDRFVISDYYTTHELFNQNAYKRFKRNIQIIGFGEYGEGCVKAATNVLIPDMLISHGITSKSIVLDEKSYFLNTHKLFSDKVDYDKPLKGFSKSPVFKKEQRRSYLVGNTHNRFK